MQKTDPQFQIAVVVQKISSDVKNDDPSVKVPKQLAVADAQSDKTVKKLAAADDRVVVAKGQGVLRCFNFADDLAPRDVQLPVVRTEAVTVKCLTLDSSQPSHCIVSVRRQKEACGVFYVNWHTQSVLSIRKGLAGELVNAVAWMMPPSDAPHGGAALLGTEHGAIHEVYVDGRGDKVQAHILDLKDKMQVEKATSIEDMRAVPVGHNGVLIMVATLSHLVAMVGQGSGREMLAPYRRQGGITRRTDQGRPLHVVATCSEGARPSRLQLRCSTTTDTQPWNSSVTWLWQCTSVLHWGTLQLNPADEMDEAAYFQNTQSLDLKTLPSIQGTADSVGLTEFYIVVVGSGPDVYIINRALKTLAQTVPLPPYRDDVMFGTLPSIVPDEVRGLLYLHRGNTLMEIHCRDEGVDMWRSFLQLKDYAQALVHCRTPQHKHTVRLAQADHLFERREYLAAVEIYGSLQGARPSFEEVALRFLDADAHDALQRYLDRKLDQLPNGSQAQATMIATWLLDLHLQKINAKMIEIRKTGTGVSPSPVLVPPPAAFSPDSSAQSGAAQTAPPPGSEAPPGSGQPGQRDTEGRSDQALGALPTVTAAQQPATPPIVQIPPEEVFSLMDNPAVAAEVEVLRKFLSVNRGYLDVATTNALLATYGLMDALLHYARERGDHEASLEFYVNRQEAHEAISILRSPDMDVAYVYKYAPALMSIDPEATADFLIGANPPLEPKRLLPALLRMREGQAGAEARAHALRYVLYCLEKHRSTDPAIHNYACWLLAQQPSEKDFLNHLAAGSGWVGAQATRHYDVRLALRLARAFGRSRATVWLLREVGAFEEALDHAMNEAGDLKLAKEVAGDGRMDQAQQRKLWLRIARTVISHHADPNDALSPGVPPPLGIKTPTPNDADSTRGDEEYGDMNDSDGSDTKLGVGHYDDSSPTGNEQPQQDAELPSALKAAQGLLKDSNGVLKIEDLLPLFPDMVSLGNIKAELVAALRKYLKEMQDLSTQMRDAVGSTDELREDLANLERRRAVVSLSMACASCGRPLSSHAPLWDEYPRLPQLPPYLIFPSKLAYHTECACREVLALLPNPQQQELKELLSRLAAATPPPTAIPPNEVQQQSQSSARGSSALSNIPTNLTSLAGPLLPSGLGQSQPVASGQTSLLEPVVEDMEAAVDAILDMVGQECPRNGELVINMVDLPLCLPDEPDLQAFKLDGEELL